MECAMNIGQSTVECKPPTLTRREILINSSRLLLLKWRLVRGRALPALASALLAWLDRWALRIHREAE